MVKGQRSRKRSNTEKYSIFFVYPQILYVDFRFFTDVLLYQRPFSDIDINDLEQGQGHLIRAQMYKIIPFLGCDYMSIIAKL